MGLPFILWGERTSVQERFHVVRLVAPQSHPTPYQTMFNSAAPAIGIQKSLISLILQEKTASAMAVKAVGGN